MPPSICSVCPAHRSRRDGAIDWRWKEIILVENGYVPFGNECLDRQRALLGLSAGPTPAQTLYGIGGAQRDYISINPGTGAGTLIVKMPAPANIPGISFRGSNLYAWDSASARILQLDPLTGNILTKIKIGNIGGTVGDVAFRSDGIGFLGMSGKLHQFDITVPSSKVITNSFNPNMTALAFNSADVLFGIGWKWDKLYTIDQVTGATTVVGPTGLNGSGGSGMTFASTGTLYFSGNGNLYTINFATVAATKIGPIGFSPDGLASPLTAVISAGVTIVESGGSTDVTEGGAHRHLHRRPQHRPHCPRYHHPHDGRLRDGGPSGADLYPRAGAGHVERAANRHGDRRR